MLAAGHFRVHGGPAQVPQHIALSVEAFSTFRAHKTSGYLYVAFRGFKVSPVLECFSQNVHLYQPLPGVRGKEWDLLRLELEAYALPHCAFEWFFSCVYSSVVE